MAKPKLNTKELTFCRYMSKHLTPREAAAFSGYLFPEKSGQKLMLRREITEKIKSFANEKPKHSEVADGLRRLAFGSISDVIKLISAENLAELNPEKLDLCMVSELKFSKNGGVEVKLCDRIKALERLNDLADEDAGSTEGSLLAALEKSAAKIEEGIDE